MSDRILDFSDEPVRLCCRNGLLVIQREAQDDLTVPFAEIAVVVVSHPQISLTHAVLSGLAAAGGVFITCNEARLPAGMFLPLDTHFTQAERFALQAQASLPTRKRLWQQIIRAKLRAQSSLLMDLRGEDGDIALLAIHVRSGDPDNVEALAARHYWPLLFKDPNFTRNRTADDQNRLLNYGYAVLRAIVARAVCAAGLHPSLGLHHHNRYDAFCLADDLMEPFRPIVDAAVVRWTDAHGPQAPLDRDAKAALLAALGERIKLDGESRTLFDVVSRLAQSLAAVFASQREDLILPEL